MMKLYSAGREGEAGRMPGEKTVRPGEFLGSSEL